MIQVLDRIRLVATQISYRLRIMYKLAIVFIYNNNLSIDATLSRYSAA
jgi:hypothetical protein